MIGTKSIIPIKKSISNKQEIPIACFMAKCSKKVPMHRFLDHLRRYHRNNVNGVQAEKYPIEWWISGNKDAPARWPPYYFVCFQNEFLYVAVNTEHGSFEWMWIIEEEEEAKRFHVKCILEGVNKNVGTTWIGPVHSIRKSMNEIIQSGECFVTNCKDVHSPYMHAQGGSYGFSFSWTTYVEIIEETITEAIEKKKTEDEREREKNEGKNIKAKAMRRAEIAKCIEKAGKRSKRSSLSIGQLQKARRSGSIQSSKRVSDKSNAETLTDEPGQREVITQYSHTELKQSVYSQVDEIVVNENDQKKNQTRKGSKQSSLKTRKKESIDGTKEDSSVIRGTRAENGSIDKPRNSKDKELIKTDQYRGENERMDENKRNTMRESTRIGGNKFNGEGNSSLESSKNQEDNKDVFQGATDISSINNSENERNEQEKVNGKKQIEEKSGVVAAKQNKNAVPNASNMTTPNRAEALSTIPENEPESTDDIENDPYSASSNSMQMPDKILKTGEGAQENVSLTTDEQGSILPLNKTDAQYPLALPELTSGVVVDTDRVFEAPEDPVLVVARAPSHLKTTPDTIVEGRKQTSLRASEKLDSVILPSETKANAKHEESEVSTIPPVLDQTKLPEPNVKDAATNPQYHYDEVTDTEEESTTDAEEKKLDGKPNDVDFSSNFQTYILHEQRECMIRGKSKLDEALRQQSLVQHGNCMSRADRDVGHHKAKKQKVLPKIKEPHSDALNQGNLRKQQSHKNHYPGTHQGSQECFGSNQAQVKCFQESNPENKNLGRSRVCENYIYSEVYEDASGDTPNRPFLQRPSRVSIREVTDLPIHPHHHYEASRKISLGKTCQYQYEQSQNMASDTYRTTGLDEPSGPLSRSNDTGKHISQPDFKPCDSNEYSKADASKHIHKAYRSSALTSPPSSSRYNNQNKIEISEHCKHNSKYHGEDKHFMDSERRFRNTSSPQKSGIPMYCKSNSKSYDDNGNVAVNGSIQGHSNARPFYPLTYPQKDKAGTVLHRTCVLTQHALNASQHYSFDASPEISSASRSPSSSSNESDENSRNFLHLESDLEFHENENSTNLSDFTASNFPQSEEAHVKSKNIKNSTLSKQKHLMDKQAYEYTVQQAQEYTVSRVGTARPNSNLYLKHPEEEKTEEESPLSSSKASLSSSNRDHEEDENSNGVPYGAENSRSTRWQPSTKSIKYRSTSQSP